MLSFVDVEYVVVDLGREMKRGRDDERVFDPMFLKLNVNVNEKGGPRAPPMNKMALYEQLSIFSLRFKPGSIHRISKDVGLVPSPSSLQELLDKNTFGKLGIDHQMIMMIRDAIPLFMSADGVLPCKSLSYFG